MAGKGKPLKGVGTAGPYSGDIKKGGKSGFNELSWSLKDFDGVKLQRIHKK
jgi:hypothetical protein